MKQGVTLSMPLTIRRGQYWWCISAFFFALGLLSLVYFCAMYFALMHPQNLSEDMRHKILLKIPMNAYERMQETTIEKHFENIADSLWVIYLNAPIWSWLLFIAFYWADYKTKKPAEIIFGEKAILVTPYSRLNRKLTMQSNRYSVENFTRLVIDKTGKSFTPDCKGKFLLAGTDKTSPCIVFDAPKNLNEKEFVKFLKEKYSLTIKYNTPVVPIEPV